MVLVDTGPALEDSGTAQVLGDVEALFRSFSSVDEFRSQLTAMHASGDREVLDDLASGGVVKRLDGRYEPALDPGVLGAVGAEGSEAGASPALEGALWSALRALRCPVLLVRGGLSAVLSEQVATEMVDQALSDGRLETLPDAGHACMIDDGPGLAHAISDFAGTLS